MGEAAIWWLAVELIGLIAFPFTFAALRFLPDRGYSVTKVVGLLLITYPIWLGEHSISSRTGACPLWAFSRSSSSFPPFSSGAIALSSLASFAIVGLTSSSPMSSSRLSSSFACLCDLLQLAHWTAAATIDGTSPLSTRSSAASISLRKTHGFPATQLTTTTSASSLSAHLRS